MLRRSSDRKVTPAIRRQASKDAPQLANSFGLPAGITCPGRTSVCEGICYAANLERAYTSTARLVAENYRTLEALGEDVPAMVTHLTAMVRDFVDDARKLSVKTGRELSELLIFRIHWDGDFYSVAYATAWAQTMRLFPEVRFWAYTRSFRTPVDVVPVLASAPNLALYLSVDADNKGEAVDVLDRFPNVRMAVLSQTQDDAQGTAVAIRSKKVPACPENVRRLPLVVALDGRKSTPVAVGDDAQGACAACGLCVNGTADVRFSISKG